MAGGLKTLLRLLPAMVITFLAGVASLGYGQSDTTLTDPTRPPLQVDPAPPTNAAAAASRGGLQTVILREGHKPMAVINGVQVELGGKLGDATLVKLNESEAVLLGPTGRETLRMTPGVEKTSATSDQAVPRASQGNAKHGIQRKPDGTGEQSDKRTAGQTQAPPQPNPTQ